MKKILPVLFAILILNNASPAWANVEEYDWFDKLGRGALNIVTSPVEIARQITITSNEGSLLEGWTLGLVKGVGVGLVRMGAGFIDLLTFPFDFPEEDKGPLIDPEFVWEKPGVQYT
jgi:putative exosortase-associated protein (TIGR04073 family)